MRPSPRANPRSDAAATDLLRRFEQHLCDSNLLPRGGRITLALSGGVDSIVLLDLLIRLQPAWGWSIEAAHFDHGMREGSAADARWVHAHCEERGIVCRSGRARRTPGNEAEARRLRYRFLRYARADAGGGLLVTAHQADDQAETVLFRLLRGSGMRGLAGIPARRSPDIARPLLPFWRAEIEDYARARELGYREDPTNRSVGPARNWIRHRLIPALESSNEPRLRRRLVRLSELATRAERSVRGRIEAALEPLIQEVDGSRILVARSGLSAYDDVTRSHLVRALVARVGPRPGRVGTRLALEFISRGQSGREMELAGGVRIRREFDRLSIERVRDGEAAPDVELSVPDMEGGSGEVRIAGVCWRVRWVLSRTERSECFEGEVAHFDPTELRFPLEVRAWRPGDRIRMPAGTRKLKKLFVDRRVELSRRSAHPVLADGQGVLWIVGVAQGARAAADADRPALTVRMEREG